MRKIAVVWVFAAIFGLSVAAFAEDAKSGGFAVVDVNRIMQTTKAGKGALEEIENKRKEYQAGIAKEEQGLRSAEQTILKKKDSMSKEEFDKQRTAFEKKVVDGQKMVQDKRQTLDRVFFFFFSKLRAEAAKVIASIAKEKGFASVLTKDAVILAMPEMDITSDVIKKMDDTVKKVSVDWSPAKK